MASFSISRDRLNVLRIRRQAYPAISLDDQETLELAGASYGFVVKRNETLDAHGFIALPTKPEQPA